MRLFGGERVQSLMDSMGVEEDMPIENKILSNTIESSQRKIEGRNFQIRKNVLQYDDVMNRQREIIYSQRRTVLDGEDVSGSIRSMADQLVEETVDRFLLDDGIKDEWNLDGLRDAVKETVPGGAARSRLFARLFALCMENGWPLEQDALDRLLEGAP